MNTMNTCPTCRKQLPEDPLINFCPYCGIRLTDGDPAPGSEIDIVIEDEKEPEEQPEPVTAPPDEPQTRQTEDHNETGGTPWEDGQDRSFVERLTHTWTESIFHPADFFRNMKIINRIAPALIYGFIFKFLGQVLGNFWARKQLSSVAEQMDQMPAFFQLIYERYVESVSQMGAVEQIVLTPFMVLFSMLIIPAIFHASMSLFGVARNGFATTFRVNAYAEGAAIFQAIPFLGGMIYFIVWMMVVVIGWRECHETSTSRVLISLVIPFFACCAFVFIFITMLGNLVGV